MAPLTRSPQRLSQQISTRTFPILSLTLPFLLFLSVADSGCGDSDSGNDPRPSAGAGASGTDVNSGVAPYSNQPGGIQSGGAEGQPPYNFPPDVAPDPNQPGGIQSGGTEAGGTEAQPPGNLPPTASFEPSHELGPAALQVAFNASGSADPDGTIVQFDWDFGEGSTATGDSVEHTFNDPGCHNVVLTVTDDGGATASVERTIVATDGLPTGKPEVSFDALPLPMAVLPRNLSTNKGTAHVSGTVSTKGHGFVVVEVSQGETVVESASSPLCSVAANDPFELSVPVPVALQNHTVSIYVRSANEPLLVKEVKDIVAGDVIIVQGQSNAVAGEYNGDASPNAGPFLRSFGRRTEDGEDTAADKTWQQTDDKGVPGPIGQWALRMGRLLIDEHQVPLAILNGARGGRPIDYFQRNDADPTDLSTNYGRLLTRVRAAGLENHIRAILYYQGEADGSSATDHHDGWIALHADWLEDYPSVERTYVTQVRKGCGGPSPELRNIQRLFADEVAEVSVMSTNGLDGHDGCHFAFKSGYEQLGEWYAVLLSRDLFNGPTGPDIDAPNVQRIYFSNSNGTEITIELRDSASTMSFDAGAESDFMVEGSSADVTAGATNGSDIVLTLSESATGASGLSYVGHSEAGPWVTNASGIGLLAFHDVPIE